MITAKSMLRPYLLPFLKWLYKVRNVRNGAIYGLSRPAWWPARYWLLRRWSAALPGWLGPEHPYDGKRVELRVGGNAYTFLPAIYNRYRGHRCDGHIPAEPQTIATYLSALGYAADDAPILAAVSMMEGGFDTIQTYDRAKFSWGFIQFAGNGGLIAVLQQIKADDPPKFEHYFARHGIDVCQGRLQIRTESGAESGTEPNLESGTAALNRLHDDPRLWKHFILASLDEAIQRVQVKTAYERYFLHMLARSERIGAVDFSYSELFADHLYGRAILYDRAVHRGVAYTSRLFKHALHQAVVGGSLSADAVIEAARQLEPIEQHARWDKIRMMLDHFQESGIPYATLHD